MSDRNEYRPDVVTSPGQTLRETMDALGITTLELAERLGMAPKEIEDILRDAAPITAKMAIKLEKALGVPASFWSNRERRYRGSSGQTQK